MTKAEKSPKKITQAQLLQAVSDASKTGSSVKYGFILGAGASVKSGIPAGGYFAKRWYKKIKEDLDEEALKTWQDSIEGFDENNLAASYTKLFAKRFEVDYNLGYEELQRHMSKANPSIGYSFLAQVLAKTPNKFIITTNFDTMSEDALFDIKDAKPLVLGHEVLSTFVNAASPTRPTIIKIHRDFLFDPYNTDDKINQMDEQWQKALQPVLLENAMIVIGYGGNDESLMNYLEKIKDRKPIYWCCRKEDKLSDKINNLLRETDFIIEIDSFDKFMLMLNDKLGFEALIDKDKIENSLIIKNARARAEAHSQQLADLTKEDLDEPEQKAIKKLLPSWWDYELAVRAEKDITKKDQIYQDGMREYPKSHELMVHYAVFLHEIRKEYDKAKKYYQKVLVLDPVNANYKGNYASFLHEIRKDYDQAEKYYQKALALDPEDANINGNYANFLYKIRKDYDQAEKYYQKALALDPEDANSNGNYAIFLKNIRKDYDQAEKYYQKALALDARNVFYNNNYAIFLSDIRKDYDQAEKYYQKALALDPECAGINSNYAQLLLITNRKPEADKYLETAFANMDAEANNLALELWFYRLAHYPEFLEQAKKELDCLLAEGHKLLHWNLDDNIKQAEKEGFNDIQLLKDYAKKITQE